MLKSHFFKSKYRKTPFLVPRQSRNSVLRKKKLPLKIETIKEFVITHRRHGIKYEILILAFDYKTIR
jgi:hypothetical protein